MPIDFSKLGLPQKTDVKESRQRGGAIDFSILNTPEQTEATTFPEGGFPEIEDIEVHGFFQSLKDEFLTKRGVRKVPIAGGVLGAAQERSVQQAANRLSQGFDYSKPIGRRDPRELQMQGIQIDPTDPTTLNIYANELRDRADVEEYVDYITRDRTLGGEIAQGISGLPTWILEFALTGGTAQLGKEAARSGMLKLLQGHTKSKLGQTALRAAGWTGGAITRGTLGLAPRTAEEATRRQTEVDIGLREDEPWATSIAKAWGNQVIEAASEEAGGEITKRLGQLVGGLPKGKAFLAGLKKAWIKATGESDTVFNKLLNRGGYSNIIGEVGEEDLGRILRGITGVSDKEGNPVQRVWEELKEGYVPENKLVEFAVLVVPAGARVGAAQLPKLTGTQQATGAVKATVEPREEPEVGVSAKPKPAQQTEIGQIDKRINQLQIDLFDVDLNDPKSDEMLAEINDLRKQRDKLAPEETTPSEAAESPVIEKEPEPTKESDKQQPVEQSQAQPQEKPLDKEAKRVYANTSNSMIDRAKDIGKLPVVKRGEAIDELEKDMRAKTSELGRDFPKVAARIAKMREDLAKEAKPSKPVEKVEPGARQQKMSEEEIIKQLEKKQFHGTIDRYKRGKITLEQARGELEGTIQPESTETKPPDPYETARELKSEGVDRQASWSRWVQRTSLKPGMDAKDWYKIYDSVQATPETGKRQVLQEKAVKEPWKMTKEEWEGVIEEFPGRSESHQKLLFKKKMLEGKRKTAQKAFDITQSPTGIGPAKAKLDKAKSNIERIIEQIAEEEAKERDVAKKLISQYPTVFQSREGYPYLQHTGAHKDTVKNAVDQGKPVPESVLQEYKGEKWADEAFAKLQKPEHKPTVEVNGKKYRFTGKYTSPGTSEQIGVWEFEYKGQWRPVKNVELRKQADAQLQQQVDKPTKQQEKAVKEPRPQVAQPTVKDSNVSFISKNGESLKGKSYLLPGFEEYDFVTVRPRGNKAKGTKVNWSVYELRTGGMVAQIRPTTKATEYLNTEQAVLEQAIKRLKHIGKAKLDETIQRAEYKPTKLATKETPPVEPAGKVVEKAPKITKTHQKGMVDFSGIIQAGQQAKERASRIKRGTTRFTGLESKVRQNLIKVEERERQIPKEAAKESIAEYGKLSNKDSLAVIQHLDNPKKYPIDPRLQSYVNEVKKSNQESGDILEDLGYEADWPQGRIDALEEELDRLLAIEKKTGKELYKDQKKKLADSIAELDGLGYVHRAYLKPNTIQKIKGYMTKRLSKRPGGLATQRTFNTLDEAMEAGFKPVHLAVSEAEKMALARRGQLHNELIEAINTNNELALKDKLAPDDWVQIDPHMMPASKGKRYHPAIAEAINELLYTPQSHGLTRAYDKFNTTLKLIMFYNPLVMSKNDLFQAWRATGFGFMEKMPEALREVRNQGQKYQMFRDMGVYNNVINLVPSAKMLAQDMVDKIRMTRSERVAQHLAKYINPTQIVDDMVTINNATTWKMDEVLRTACVLAMLEGTRFTRAANKLSMGVLPKSFKDRNKLTTFETVEQANDFMANYGKFPRHTRKVTNRVFFTPTYRVSMIRVLGQMYSQPRKMWPQLVRHIAYKHFLRYVLPGLTAMWVLGEWEDENAQLERGYRIAVRDPEGKEDDRVFSLSDPLLEENKLLNRPFLQSLQYNLSAGITFLAGIGKGPDWRSEKQTQMLRDAGAPGIITALSKASHLFKLGTPVIRDIGIWYDQDKTTAEKFLTQFAIAYVYTRRPTKADQEKGVRAYLRSIGMYVDWKAQAGDVDKAIGTNLRVKFMTDVELFDELEDSTYKGKYTRKDGSVHVAGDAKTGKEEYVRALEKEIASRK